MKERKGAVTMKGEPLTLVGRQPVTGEAAADFEALGNDLAAVRLGDFRGRAVVICSVPSLDTSVCDRMTRRFNDEAGRLGEDAVVLTISMDLPFAQKRWCGAAGASNVRAVSDHRSAEFGMKYGVLIKELRLLARAVFVVDKNGVIRYVEIVKELADEPKYEAALEVVKGLIHERAKT